MTQTLLEMKGAKIATLSLALAGFSGIAAAQAVGPQADWATTFLNEWGWLGLFVLSALLNIFQFKRAEKQAQDSAKIIEGLRDQYRVDMDDIRDEHKREIKEATDKLIQEYQIRIQQLSASKA